MSRGYVDSVELLAAECRIREDEANRLRQDLVKAEASWSVAEKEIGRLQQELNSLKKEVRPNGT